MAHLLQLVNLFKVAQALVIHDFTQVGLELLGHLLFCLLLFLLKRDHLFFLLLALDFLELFELLFVFLLEQLVALSEANDELHLRSLTQLDKMDIVALGAQRKVNWSQLQTLLTIAPWVADVDLNDVVLQEQPLGHLLLQPVTQLLRLGSCLEAPIVLAHHFEAEQ